ncbi:hypothetical protein [Rivularia sp. UHCC 0363]|uniref:hypothetical protein n=1 Tax=Rivularia sp. UHCC 0363 TaxID=3110244 RepID=UPI003A5999A3
MLGKRFLSCVAALLHKTKISKACDSKALLQADHRQPGMPAKNHISQKQKERLLKMLKEYENLLLEIVDKEPAEYGYDFGRWTSARLATYLETKTGIKLSSLKTRFFLVFLRMVQDIN